MLFFRSEDHIDRWCQSWRFSRGGVLSLQTAGNSHMPGIAPSGGNRHGAAELSRKPSNYLGSWVSQAHSGIYDNVRPNSSQQPTRGRSLARRFRASLRATLRVALAECEGRERLSER